MKSVTPTALWISLFAFSACADAADIIPYTIRTYSSFETLKADTARKCEFVSHDCEICAPAEDGTFMCSSVGTACQPKEWRCYEKEPAAQ